MCDESWGMSSAHICDATLLCHGQGAARRPALFKWKEKQKIWWGEVWVKAWKSWSTSLDCTLNCKRASLACLDNDIFIWTFKILILAALGRLQGRGKSESTESAWGDRRWLLHRRLREVLRNGTLNLYRKAINLE